VAAIEVADVSFLKRKRKEPKLKPQDASISNADAKLDELRQRVRALDNVRTVVTIRTRSQKQN
jgi:hypothetical protein